MIELCDTFIPEDRWLGQDHDSPQHGCDVNCTPCPMVTPMHVGVRDDGPRWFRASEEHASRDAFGKMHALRSSRPHLYPTLAHFDLAPCYFNRGLECYNMLVCPCDPELDVIYGNDWEYGDPDCRDGTNIPELRRSPLPDTNVFTGHEYDDNSSTWMRCRTESVRTMGPLTTAIRTGRGFVYQGMELRSRRCASNLLIMAIGRVHWGDCLPGEQVVYHNNGAQRGLWRRWYVTNLDVSLAADPTRHPEIPGEAQAAFDAQNAALEYACQHQGELALDQIEKSDHAGNDNWENPNSALCIWSRSFQADPETAPVYLEPADGVQLTILSARIIADIVLQRVIHPVGDDTEAQLWPLVRVTLTLRLGKRGAGECPFTPPHRVEWHGSVQRITDEDMEPINWWGPDTSHSEPGGTNVNYCRDLAAQFGQNTPLVIKGKPDVYTDPEQKVRRYQGDLELYLNA